MAAQYEHVLRDISTRLTSAVIPMGSVHELGTRRAGFIAYRGADHAFRTGLTNLLAAHSDALLAAFIDDEPAVGYGQLRDQLAVQTKQAIVHPVYFDSAPVRVWLRWSTASLSCCPAAVGDLHGPVSGTVFKIDRGPAHTTTPQGSAYLLEGEIPAPRVHDLQRQLPGLTSGGGALDCVFQRYQPVSGAIPTRPRSYHNPLNRKEYLLRVSHRVAGRQAGT